MNSNFSNLIIHEVFIISIEVKEGAMRRLVVPSLSLPQPSSPYDKCKYSYICGWLVGFVFVDLS